MRRLFATSNDWSGLIARLAIGVVIFPHGAQKLFGWWNGFGFSSSMDFFTQTVGLPYFIGVLVILIEFFCPLLLVLGLATRIAALLTFIVMAGIVLTVQDKYFFMNWFGTQTGEGMEFFFLAMGLCLVLVLDGGGKLSADRRIIPAL